MKKHILFIIVLFSVVFACSDMNDMHDVYLRDGEDIYIGKFDSLLIFTGNERVMFRLWDKDPRAKTAMVYWYPFNDTIMFTLNPRPNFTEVFIENIREGSYTFNFITYDNWGNHSIPLEKMVKIYGERYLLTLFNRTLKKTDYDLFAPSLTLYFAETINENEIGIELKYSDNSGKGHIVYFDNERIRDSLKITDIDITSGVFYRSLFLPEPNAIDTFSIDFISVENLPLPAGM